MEHSVLCLDRQHFLKSNETVRLSRSLISLFDNRVDNRVKLNITRLRSWLQLLLLKVEFWEISDYHEGTRGKFKPCTGNTVKKTNSSRGSTGNIRCWGFIQRSRIEQKVNGLTVE